MSLSLPLLDCTTSFQVGTGIHEGPFDYAENLQAGNPPILGFGEYEGHDLSHPFRATNKAQALGLMFLYAGSGVVTTVSCVIIIVSSATILAGTTVLLVAAFFGSTVVFLALALKSCLEYLALSKGPSTSILGLNASDHGSLPLGVFSNPINKGFVCEDSTQSTEWKLKLIDLAKDSIILSGCYCGESIFDLCLEKIDCRMREKENLRTYILTSDLFLTPSNKIKIEELRRQYPERFLLVETPRVIHVNPGIKFTTNHTKALVVDRKYAVIGGSALDDKNATMKGDSTPDRVPLNEAPPSCLKQILADAFRDMDFVLYCPEERGFSHTLHLELLKLMARWRFYTEEKWDPALLIANEPRLDGNLEEEGDAHFIDENGCIDRISCKVYATGPEHVSNAFLQELLEHVKNAQNTIYIDHLYFHPTKEMVEALLQASRRGVQIHIVTNGNDEQLSPAAHNFFAAKSLYNYRYLLQNGNPDCIFYHEYIIEGVTLHKKVIVIDEKMVIAGSGNCGFKSIKMFDYELNVFMASAELARKTLEVIQRDIELARRVEVAPLEHATIPVGLTFKAYLQSFFGPLIG
jgi:hypothetical protein